jgi:hypothetical protein
MKHATPYVIKIVGWYSAGMSNFKQVVIDFLVSKLPVIYHPLLSSYFALSKNIGKNNTTHDVCCESNILSRVEYVT